MSHLIPVEYPYDDEDLPFSQKFFFSLLATNLSLDVSDKTKVLNVLPTLNRCQMLELVELWLKERTKFVKLSKEHTDEIKQLLQDTTEVWQTLKQNYELPDILSEEELVQQIEALSENGLYHFELNFWKYLNGNDEDDDEDNDSEEDTENEESEEVEEIETDAKHHTDEEMTQEVQDEEQKASPFSPMTNLGVDKDMDKAMSQTTKLVKPDEVYESLSKIVIGQHEALELLSVMLYYHKLFAIRAACKYSRASSDSPLKYIGTDEDYARQQPILLIGATGTGKTHLVKHITKAYHLNVITVDCSTMVRTGIVGTSLETIGRMIYEGANQDVCVAETSVVVLDEFDKLFLEHNKNLEIAMQLLTVIEGSVPFPVERYSQEKFYDYPLNISSERMLFIVAGSFGVHQQNSNRHFKGFNIGDFDRSLEEYDHFTLSEMGVPDELLGRIGRIVCLRQLSVEDYIKVLYQSPTSPWNVLQNQLKMVGCTAELPEEVVMDLIDYNQDAIDKFGARGLYQAFNRLSSVTDILQRATLEKGTSFNQDGHFVVVPD